ncbi:DEAD/DEAH box helicase [Phocoenobacter atlanticus]|uniref:DEAD/DEAH box helicase n=1 Tax=Phocoenobacter atlanticus TaxID=3416742 RepID=UPI002745B9E2|nr:DEAD/DEAH box helicase [Pasteurella atlantica]MDP8101349.1 DEAD/DEAH box helicase [Pasteurella atlantica]
MDITTKIRDYIEKYADLKIQKRAGNILLHFSGKKNGSYIFTYKGTKREPYHIDIEFIKRAIFTNCTCPYNFGGLCKHEVAALNYISDFLIDENNNLMEEDDKVECDLPDDVIKKFQQGEIQLVDHLLSEDMLLKLRDIYPSYFSFDDVRLKKVTESEVEGIVCNNIHILCQYDINTQILRFEMKNTEKEYFDFVILTLLKIICNLGKDFFDPDYKQKLIQGYFQENSIDHKYESYFDIKVINEKATLVSKIPNFYVKTDALQKGLLLSENDEIALDLLPEKMHSPETSGFGFCIKQSWHSASKFDFVLFHGKFKKNTREISSALKPIYDHNFLDYFNAREEQEQQMLVQAFALVSELEEFRIRADQLSLLSEIYVKFKHFIDNHKDSYPFFIKPDRDTNFARKNIEPVIFSDSSAKLFFKVKKTKQRISVIPKICIDDKEYKINDSELFITSFFCIKNGQTLHFFDSPKDFVYLKKFNFKSEINFPSLEQEAILTNVIHPLSKHFDVVHNLVTPKPLPSDLILHKEIYISDFQELYIVFKLGVRYGDCFVTVDSNEAIFDEKTQQWLQRDKVFEEAFSDYFQSLHPDFAHQQGKFYLSPYKLLEDEWLIKISQKLQQHNIELFGVKDLKSFNYSLHTPTIKLAVDSEIDWFDLKIQVSFGKEKVALKDIKQAVLNKQKFVRLKDGSMGILPEKWLRKIANYFKVGKVGENGIQISHYQFNLLDELYEQLEKKPEFLKELYRKKQSLEQLHNKAVENIAIPKGLQAQLRPYQQEGFNWLVFLHNNHLGGCLADDMGLGKTLQTIALLLYLKENSKISISSPHLIVAPTSLIFNWQKEIEKFAPNLKVLIYTGMSRHDKYSLMNEVDVVITTYGTVVNDIENLQQQKFSYIIADESQAMKNPNSKRYKAMRLLEANNRLALTGTPIENNTFDLYAQMNFINSGMLGSMKHFKTTFSDAIDKEKDVEAATLLHKMVYPFLLRRTKSQVAQDLPPKTENIIFCEMEREQRQVYDAFKEKYRTELLNKMEQEGEQSTQLHILQGLTKLRQICNAPQLLDDGEGSYTKASIKLDILLEYVLEIMTQGSKILIFSQFTSMLSLVKARLESEGIVFEYLDGQTMDRQKRVSNFQENDEVKVFLISLKAGGTGLNLTKAEYVFLLDPWWNPAVENQAIDRCYRIGQDKHVIAYRMICKDTIEEKIMALQSDKKRVSESIIQVDKDTKSFDKAQVKALFS